YPSDMIERSTSYEILHPTASGLDGGLGGLLGLRLLLRDVGLRPRGERLLVDAGLERVRDEGGLPGVDAGGRVVVQHLRRNLLVHAGLLELLVDELRGLVGGHDLGHCVLLRFGVWSLSPYLLITILAEPTAKRGAPSGLR